MGYSSSSECVTVQGMGSGLLPLGQTMTLDFKPLPQEIVEAEVEWIIPGHLLHALSH